MRNAVAPHRNTHSLPSNPALSATPSQLPASLPATVLKPQPRTARPDFARLLAKAASVPVQGGVKARPGAACLCPPETGADPVPGRQAPPLPALLATPAAAPGAPAPAATGLAPVGPANVRGAPATVSSDGQPVALPRAPLATRRGSGQNRLSPATPPDQRPPVPVPQPSTVAAVQCQKDTPASVPPHAAAPLTVALVPEHAGRPPPDDSPAVLPDQDGGAAATPGPPFPPPPRQIGAPSFPPAPVVASAGPGRPEGAPPPPPAGIAPSRPALATDDPGQPVATVKRAVAAGASSPAPNIQVVLDTVPEAAAPVADNCLSGAMQAGVLAPAQGLSHPATTGTASTTTGPAAATLAGQASAASPPAAQLGQAVASLHAAADGGSRLTLRLHPAELGHLQVQITRDGAGATSVSVAVERPETLRLLQADLGHLHQALDRAGLPGQRGVELHLASAQAFSANPGQGGSTQPGFQGQGQYAGQHPGQHGGQNGGQHQGDGGSHISGRSSVLIPVSVPPPPTHAASSSQRAGVNITA